MSIVTVREAVLADLDAIVPLFDAYRRFYGKAGDLPTARAFLRDRFGHGESVIFLARLGEADVGFTQLYPSFSSVSLARVFILNDLFVREDARRSGVGARLLGAAVTYARSLGAVRLSLNTDVANEAAQAFYAAQGWRRDEQFHAYHHSLGS